MAVKAVLQPGLGIIFDIGNDAVLHHPPRELAERGARSYHIADVAPVGPEVDEAAIAEDERIVAVEKSEPFRNAFDRFHQPRLRRLRLQLRGTQFVIGLLQLTQRILQPPRSLPHLVFENDRRLEQGIGVALKIDAALHLLHQHPDDLPQLFRIARQADVEHGSGSAQPGSDPKPIATPVNV